MTPDLSIIILSWNVSGLLASCLRSLPDACGAWWNRAEVLVVDNASSDRSPEMVRNDFPDVRLLPLESNLGFSGGNNYGIRAARGKYMLLLNADTVAEPGSIEQLADYIERHETTGIVGPRLLNPDVTLQSSRRRFPTVLSALIESTPLQPAFSNSKLLRRFYMLDRADEETQAVDWLSGAALMCRSDALKQTGLLDPGYFMFSEELDLCRRMRGAGWSVVYLPQSEIRHYGGQSTGQDVPARHVHFNTSKARYFRLHEGTTAGRIVRLYLLLVYAAQTASEAFKWLLGHKRPLRQERLRLYAGVLRSGLRERRTLHLRPVLLITGEYPPARGGVGDYTCKLAASLQAKGVCITVLTRRIRSFGLPSPQNGPPTPAPEANALPQSLTRGVLGALGASVVKKRRRHLIPMQTNRITFRSALRAIRSSRARVAHIQYQTGAYNMSPAINLLPLMLKLKWSGRTVVTFHDLLVPYLFPKAGPVREWANRLLAQSADAIIATNPDDAERLRRWGAKHLTLIPIGSNIQNKPPPGYNRDAWRSKWRAGPETILLAYFGFLNSSKGLDDLLYVLSALRQKGDFRLLMIGGGIGSSDPTNRSTAAYLSDLARKEGVDDLIEWTGFLPPEEVSAALLSADIAVLPFADGASFRRGSLMAVLEHGLPVVTTSPKVLGDHKSVRGIHDWPRLQHGINALLVTPGDQEGLAREIMRLASNTELRDRLSRGSSALARYFSWERIASLHTKLYKQL